MCGSSSVGCPRSGHNPQQAPSAPLTWAEQPTVQRFLVDGRALTVVTDTSVFFSSLSRCGLPAESPDGSAQLKTCPLPDKTNWIGFVDQGRSLKGSSAYDSLFQARKGPADNPTGQPGGS